MPQNPHIPHHQGSLGESSSIDPHSHNFPSQEATFSSGRISLLLLLPPAVPGAEWQGPQQLLLGKPTLSLQTGVPAPITSVAFEGGISIHKLQRLFGSLQSWCNEAGCLFFHQMSKGKWHPPRIWTNFFRRRKCENCTDPCYLKHLRRKLQEVVGAGHKGHHLPALLSHFSVELTGQLPVITGHTRKCLAAKQKGTSEGLAVLFMPHK